MLQVNGCEVVSGRIGEVLSMEDEVNHRLSSKNNIPNKFFEEMEASWMGHLKKTYMPDAYEDVEKAAEALSLAVTNDFYPITSRANGNTISYGGGKGEIVYAKQHKAVWYKIKSRAPTAWDGFQEDVLIRALRPAVASNGRKAGQDWYTTSNVEVALERYHEAVKKAKKTAVDMLSGLFAELAAKSDVLVFSSVLLIIAKALFSLVSEGRRKRWVFPTLIKSFGSQEKGNLVKHKGMQINGISPYWIDASEGGAVLNSNDMNSVFLLTGPSGSGKSTLIRAICAVALLGICGFMVPAKSAIIPQFDSVVLHTRSFDSPTDGQSSFLVEVSELVPIISNASSKSLILVDEICKGADSAQGTCLAASVIEAIDATGCLGVISTHWLQIFDLPISTHNTIFKTMAVEHSKGTAKPTWRVVNGVCKSSLAFGTAQIAGFSENVIKRAIELYNSAFHKSITFETQNSIEHVARFKEEPVVSNLIKALKKIFLVNLMDLRMKEVPDCIVIGPRQQSPPSAVGVSTVYVLQRPDAIYVGETENLQGRIKSHSSKKHLANASVLYLQVSGKSSARLIETLLVAFRKKGLLC